MLNPSSSLPPGSVFDPLLPVSPLLSSLSLSLSPSLLSINASELTLLVSRRPRPSHRCSVPACVVCCGDRILVRDIHLICPMAQSLLSLSLPSFLSLPSTLNSIRVIRSFGICAPKPNPSPEAQLSKRGRVRVRGDATTALLWSIDRDDYDDDDHRRDDADREGD